MTSPLASFPPSARKGAQGLWQAMVDQMVSEQMVEVGVPHAEANPFRVPPAEIRAMAFMASLGPTTPPATRRTTSEIVDLAGEEAFLGYLAKVAGPHAA
jgi:hypothetical protein